MSTAARAGLPPRRRQFGQHFLHDPRVLERIVRAVDAHPGDHLVEIFSDAVADYLLAIEIDTAKGT